MSLLAAAPQLIVIRHPTKLHFLCINMDAVKDKQHFLLTGDYHQ